MPEFEANMNYIPASLPSSMNQCSKSATVKFHIELHLTTTTDLAVALHLMFHIPHRSMTFWFNKLTFFHEQVSHFPSVPKNVLCRYLQNFLYLEAFASNASSNWLNNTV